MRFLKIWAAVALLFAGCAVSFCIGRNYEYKYFGEKTYNDACRMADLIRCYEDHLSEDSLIQDWGCFEELECLFLYDDAVGEPIKLSDYVYCY